MKVGLLLLSFEFAGVGCAATAVQAKSIKDADSLAHVRGDGNAVLSMGSSKSKRVCIMPPATAALNISVSTEGKLAVKYAAVDVEAAIKRGVELGVAKLVENNEQTLFVQHTLYRLCEAHANGMLEGVTRDDLWNIELADIAEQKTVLNERFEDAQAALSEQKNKVSAFSRADISPDATKARNEELMLERKVADLKLEQDGLSARENYIKTMKQQEQPPEKLKGPAYGIMFNKVFSSAVELSKVDVERQRALADRAKAEAEKAKSDVEKVKSELKANKERLEALEKKLVEASVERATRPEAKEDAKPKDDTK